MKKFRIQFNDIETTFWPKSIVIEAESEEEALKIFEDIDEADDDIEDDGDYNQDWDYKQDPEINYMLSKDGKLVEMKKKMKIFEVQIEWAHPTNINTFYVQAMDKEDAEEIASTNEDKLITDYSKEHEGDTLRETNITEVPKVPRGFKLFKVSREYKSKKK